MQQFVRYCNKMNYFEGSKLYDTTMTNNKDVQRQRQQQRRRQSVSRSHSHSAQVGNLVSTASCGGGDGGVEVFLVHERRNCRHNHLTISSTSSSLSSHHTRSQTRRRKQKGTLVLRGSRNDDDDNDDCE
jgi:hypothetical protein